MFMQHGHFSLIQNCDCLWLQIVHSQLLPSFFLFFMETLIITYVHIIQRNNAIMKKIKDIFIPDFNTINKIPNIAKPKPL